VVPITSTDHFQLTILPPIATGVWWDLGLVWKVLLLLPWEKGSE